MVGRPPKYRYRVPTLPSTPISKLSSGSTGKRFRSCASCHAPAMPRASPPTRSQLTQPSKDNPQPSKHNPQPSIMSANGSRNGNVTSGNAPPAVSTSSGRPLPGMQPSNSAADPTPTPTSTPQPMVVDVSNDSNAAPNSTEHLC